MIKKDLKHRVVGKSNGNYILLTEKTIKVVYDEVGTRALGVVTIYPQVDMQLGRTMKEFRWCLKQVRHPIVVQKVSERNKQATWYIIRMKTGNVPEARVCTVNTINDVIINIAFNQDLVYNKEYIKYGQISAIHQTKAGKQGDKSILSKAVRTVSMLTLEPTETFKIKANDNSIAVYSDKKGEKNQYAFKFVKDKNGYFNLLSVGFMVKKKK